MDTIKNDHSEQKIQISPKRNEEFANEADCHKHRSRKKECQIDVGAL